MTLPWNQFNKLINLNQTAREVETLRKEREAIIRENHMLRHQQHQANQQHQQQQVQQTQQQQQQQQQQQFSGLHTPKQQHSPSGLYM
ncbi:hypothetical protein FHG87_012202 [Trinorchestia longiramus]|nr:hypothetical protein FHG87_012202 [Trinorchestia longiramus]